MKWPFKKVPFRTVVGWGGVMLYMVWSILTPGEYTKGDLMLFSWFVMIAWMLKELEYKGK